MEPLRPILPKDISLTHLNQPSLRVRKTANPGLDAIKAEILPYGVRKSAGRAINNLEEVITMANRRLHANIKTRHLQFSEHEASGRIMVRLIDSNTGAVLRYYSSEKLLENAAILKAAGQVKTVIG